MGKANRIKKERDQKTLKALAKEVDDLGIIRKAYTVSQIDLEIVNRSKRRWKNTAIAGIPTALINGIAAGIYIAHIVWQNVGF